MSTGAGLASLCGPPPSPAQARAHLHCTLHTHSHRLLAALLAAWSLCLFACLFALFASRQGPSLEPATQCMVNNAKKHPTKGAFCNRGIAHSRGGAGTLDLLSCLIWSLLGAEASPGWGQLPAGGSECSHSPFWDQQPRLSSVGRSPPSLPTTRNNVQRRERVRPGATTLEEKSPDLKGQTRPPPGPHESPLAAPAGKGS